MDGSNSVTSRSFVRSPVFWAALVVAAWGVLVLHVYLNETGHLDYLSIPLNFIDHYAGAHFWAFLMFATAAAAGAALLRLFRYGAGSALEAWLLSYGLGIVFITALLVAMGPLGLHDALTMRIVTAVVLGVSLAILLPRQWRSRSRNSPTPQPALGPSRLTESVCLVSVVLIMLVCWIGCLLPPSRPDAVIEYLPQARGLVLSGWGWPQPGGWINARLALAWAWALGGSAPDSEVACALLVWTMSAASLAAIALWCSLLDARARWPVAALLLAASPVFQYVSDGVQIDSFVLFFVLLGVWYLFQWRESRRASHLFVSALLQGYALGCKPLAIYAFAGSAAALGLFCLTKDRFGKRWLWAWLVYVALLAALPGHTVSNFNRTGNPLYPYAASLFPSWQWPASKGGTTMKEPNEGAPANDKAAFNDTSAESQTGRGPDLTVEMSFNREWVRCTRFGSGPLDWLLLPWRVTVSGDYPNGWGNVILPSFLMLAPLLLLIRDRDKTALALFCAVYFAVWATQPQHIRYGLPGLALLGALLTAILDRRLKPSLRTGAVWLMVLTPAFLVTSAQFYEFARMNVAPFLLMRESRDAYLSRAEGKDLYKAFLFLKDLGQKAPVRVRLLGEARGYHCPVDHQADDTNLTALRHLRADSGGDPARAIEALQRGGYTHLLFNRGLFTYFYLQGRLHGKSPALAEEARKDMEFFNAMEKSGLKSIYDDAGISVYEVTGGQSAVDSGR